MLENKIVTTQMYRQWFHKTNKDLFIYLRINHLVIDAFPGPYVDIQAHAACFIRNTQTLTSLYVKQNMFSSTNNIFFHSSSP